MYLVGIFLCHSIVLLILYEIWKGIRIVFTIQVKLEWMEMIGKHDEKHDGKHWVSVVVPSKVDQSWSWGSQIADKN